MWPIVFNKDEGCQDNSMEKEQSFQQMILVQLDEHMNEVGHPLHTMHKI